MVTKTQVLRVLVVEDELLIRWSLVETLAEAGHVVLEAADGTAALRALRDTSDPVDVVLLDYRLPDSSDLALLASVRRLSPTTQVILMTAYGTPEVVKGALDLGAYRVLNKPFEMDDVVPLVLQAEGSRAPSGRMGGGSPAGFPPNIVN